MMKMTEIISLVLKDAFEKRNYLPDYGAVSLADRPDLCQFKEARF